MLSKIVTPGDKLELTIVVSDRKRRQLEEENPILTKTLISQVFEIVDDTVLKIAMPVMGSRIVPPPINSRFDMCVYTKGGLYKSAFVVLNRYKQDGIYVLEVELLRELKKFQRRQYYRLECVLDIDYICIGEDSDIRALSDDDIKKKFENEKSTRAMVLDISGGGIRFCSEEKLEAGSVVLVKLNIQVSADKCIYGVLGKVLNSTAIANNAGMYEQRIEYQGIESRTRESIIKYIFEQERKMRKR